MPVTPTIHVVERADRDKWTVEGGHGPPAVLGIVSLHDSKADAIRTAHKVAREHDAQVEIIGERVTPQRSIGE